jgi:PBSX family phage portal protein
MSSGEPYAFTTAGGEVVLKKVLDTYAIKDVKETKRAMKDPFTFVADVPDENLNEDIESKQAPEVGVNNYSFYGLIDPPYNPLLLTNLSELNTYHARCIRTKATDIGGLGYHITPIGKTENKKNEDTLNTFFELSKITDTITNGEQDKQEVGWGCLELIREGGEKGIQTGLPRKLVQVHAHTVRIHRSKRKLMQTWDGVNRRWFKRYGARNYTIDPVNGLFDVHVNTGQEFPFNSLPKEEVANEMIYNKKYTSKTSYYGVPDYIPAIRTMLGDQAAVDYNLVFFKNFGIPAYAVYITGNYVDKPILNDKGEETGKTEMQSAMEEKFKQVIENPHGSMVFMIPVRGAEASVEVHFEKLSVDTKESSFRLYRLDNRDEVVTAHGVDPYRIGINQTGSLGGNTAIEGKKSYKSSIAIPGQRSWESDLNTIILTEQPEGFGIDTHIFKLEEIDIEDESALEQSIIALMTNGVLSPNDAIRKIGSKYNVEVSKAAGMDLHYIGGKPIDAPVPQLPLDTANTPVVLEALKTLKADVLEVAKKYDS